LRGLETIDDSKRPIGLLRNANPGTCRGLQTHRIFDYRHFVPLGVEVSSFDWPLLSTHQKLVVTLASA
jgi:hypothetical protein